MGKIRIRTLGDEEQEKKQKRKIKEKKEQKKIAEAEKDLSKTPDEAKSSRAKLDPAQLDKTGKKAKFAKKKEKSKKYQTALKLVDKKKIYSLNEALEILPKIKLSNFDETVELHLNTTEIGIAGKTNLPHGTGKDLKVAIADDKILSDVEKGKIDFDVLLAAPQMMPKLAKVARILGPKGLMPNPKNGTVTSNPEEEAKKYKGGFLSFKTEAKMPIIHLIVGKLSFGDKKLAENIKAAFKAIPSDKIKNATLKSTMSPGIKLKTS